MADHADKLFVAEIFDPTKWYGALFYALAFLLGATILARLVRKATVGFGLHQKHALIDPTIVSFFGDLGQASIYILSALFYFHLIPLLHNVGTALLTGVSVVSIVVGLAAQSALSNLIAGIALLLYRPFRLGDPVELAVPGGTARAVVDSLSLGYTTLLAGDGRRIVVPNSQISNQTLIIHPPAQSP